MILLACYSVNKRAKYYRNLCFTCNNEKFENKKEKMYELKRFFLKYLKPSVIHKEIHYKEKAIKLNNNLSEEKLDSVISKAIDKGIYIKLINKPSGQYMLIKSNEISFIKYYLYYDINDYHFHYPIKESQLLQYKELNIITLHNLVESNPVSLNEIIPLNMVYEIFDILNTKH